MKSYKAQLAAMTEEQLAEFKAVRNVKAKREAKKVVEAVTALTDTTEAV